MVQVVQKGRIGRVVPRLLRLQLPASVDRHWVGGDPFLTAYFNALSLVFPPGERLFMDSVKAVRDQLKDPQLLEAVRGFLAQESMHCREHSVFNTWLARFGIDAAALNAMYDAEIARRSAARTPIQNLAVTCALEHFTALLADSWLRDEPLRALMPEALRALWTWHAIEEIEHKAVAFDVYQAVGGDYATRVRVMAMITLGFTLGIAMLQYQLLAAEGQQGNYRSILAGLVRFWGPRGMLTRLIPGYLRYYHPRFHPSQHDQTTLLSRFDLELRKAGYTMPVVRAA
ncbi:MAG: hypothetical protein RL385_5247 [Pseudomonadota bacterium]|jgi:predicted metal-dependent hydrolase